jgi:acetyl-CoA carboxylase biotin carboxyl carrier protein
MAKTKVTSTAAAKGNGNAGEDKTQNSSTMKTSEIRDLIDFIAQSGLNEVDVETKELKLHVKREPDQKVLKAAAPMVAAPVAMTAPAMSAPPAPSVPPAAGTTAAPKQEKPVSSGKATLEIKSPMIGTFYRSSNPDSPAFVSVGDKVSKGQTVCIIEAMKLFNEIESEVSGTVIKAMVENASPVEYDQVLFVVEAD